MGADMFIRGAWIGRHRDPDFDAMRARASSVTVEQLAETDDAEAFGARPFLGRRADATVDLGPYVLDDSTIDDVRLALTADVDEFENAWNGKDREAAGLEIGPYYSMLTGGMSWGDSPSELYECMNRLEAGGVLQAGGFFEEVGDLGLPVTKAGTIAQAIGATLVDRGHDRGFVIDMVADTGDDFVQAEWEATLGPMTDRMAEHFGLEPYPAEEVANG